MKKILCVLVLLVNAFCVSANQESVDNKRVLFVGNSFSFYNNGIHNHLGSLIRANGEWQRGENRLRLMTLSGGHVHEHIVAIAAHLKQDPHGYRTVVLQGHSEEPIIKSKRERFFAATEKAVEVIREEGLTPLLFMTWAYADAPEMTDQLYQAYTKIGKKLDVPVVPVGKAFALVTEQHPQIELYVKDVLGVTSQGEQQIITYRKDEKHPSVAGTYLAACVFYSYLYGQSPVGNIFTADLPLETATILQQVSWQVVSGEHNESNE